MPVWRRLLLIVVVPLLCGLAIAWGSDWDRRHVGFAVMVAVMASAAQAGRWTGHRGRPGGAVT